MGRSSKDVQVTFQLNSSAKISPPQIMSFEEWGLQTKKGFTSKTICHLQVRPCCYLQIFMPPNWCIETRPQGDGTWEDYQTKQGQLPWTGLAPFQNLHSVQRAVSGWLGSFGHGYCQHLDFKLPRLPNVVSRDFDISTLSSEDVLLSSPEQLRLFIE